MIVQSQMCPAETVVNHEPYPSDTVSHKQVFKTKKKKKSIHKNKSDLISFTFCNDLKKKNAMLYMRCCLWEIMKLN